MMKIDKAIEILEDDHARPERIIFTPGHATAIKLGIEALKRLKEHREEQIDITYNPLPGETE